MSYIIEALHKLELLTEDLASFKQSVLKRYPKANFTDEILDKLISLDPTFKEGSNNKGNYADWIIRLYANNNLKEEDFYKVTQYLSDFNKKKSNFVNKDINQFKTLPDLVKALEEVGLSHRQEVRERQKARKYADLGKEAKLVYEDDEFEVWIPKTYAASCKLGQGTQWCTASTESGSNYRQYSSMGPLFIFISKKDPEEKYQFHFESNQFMDRYDKGIDWDNWDITYLEKIFKQILNGKYDYYFSTELIIPKGVKKIERGTLIKRSVDGGRFAEKAIISNGVKSIGDYAFNNYTSLKSITIPNSVTSIGDCAFYGCKSLESITIPDSVTSIGNLAFSFCSSLESITIPDSVTRIGYDAFNHCISLKSITIPNSVSHIRDETFEHCKSLKSITIPNSVTRIGVRVFDYCNFLKLIKTQKGSFAEQYAKRMHIPVEYI